jgi:hypothetical protein
MTGIRIGDKVNPALFREIGDAMVPKGRKSDRKIAAI